MDTTNTRNIPFDGNRYTWRKKTAGENNILERLDRSIVNEDWYKAFPNASVKHLDFSISDHTPIILTTNSITSNKGRYPFRFENAWTYKKEYEPRVRKAWETRVNGSKLFQVSKKLKNLKHSSIVWAKNKLNHSKTQLIQVEKRLIDIQKGLCTNPRNENLAILLERFIKKKLNIINFNKK